MRHLLRTGLFVATASVGLGQVQFEAELAPYPAQRPFVTQLGAVSSPGLPAVSQDDAVTCSARTPSGSLIVGGYTIGSLGEPNGGGADIFVARFDPSGNLAWLTQVGAITAPTIPALNGRPGPDGGHADGSEYPTDMALGADGSILLTGYTTGSLGELEGGHGDFWVARLAADGTLKWLRQVGATTAAGITPATGATLWGDAGETEWSSAMAVDPAGGFWVAGKTRSSLSELNPSYYDSTPMLAHFDDKGLITGVHHFGEVHPMEPFLRVDFDDLDISDILLSPSGPITSVNGAHDTEYGEFWDYSYLLSYDQGGVAVDSVLASSAVARVRTILPDPSGRILVVGERDDGSCFYCGPIFDLEAGCYDPALSQWVWNTRLDQTHAASLGLIDVSRDDIAGSACLTPRGELVIAGLTEGSFDEMNAGGLDTFVVRLNAADGATLAVHQFGAATAQATGRDLSSHDSWWSIHTSPTGRVELAGSCLTSVGEPVGGGYDVIVMRLRAGDELP